MIGLLVRLVEFCRRRARFVLLATVLLTIAGGVYTARNLSIDTDTDKLLSPDLPWQKQLADFAQAFPQSTRQTIVVVESPDADAAEDATASLTAALALQTDIFKTVTRPDGGAFFDRYKLLFLSVDELSELSEQLAAAQPLIGPLYADPSLRGLFGILGQALKAASEGEVAIDALKPPILAFSKAVHSVVDGHAAPVVWGELVTGKPAAPEDLRHFIIVQAKLDTDALQPGARSSDIIRRTADALHLRDKGVTIGLTGDVPLADDEFASVTEGAGIATSLSLVLVVLILFAGLRTPRLILSIALTLIVGLVATAAFATAAVGTLNMISVAFAVLFIGIAVDFGIQFTTRFQAELFYVTGGLPPTNPAAANRQALELTAKEISTPLAIAAVAAGLGFFSFLPTDYRGVSELGLIAGTSMFIALLANLTVLPALLSALPTRARSREVGFLWARPIDLWLQSRARLIVIVAFVLGLAAFAATFFLRFDADPLDIKAPGRESVRLAIDLAGDPLASPYSIEILTPDLAAAQTLAARLQSLPEVRQAVTLASFIPDRQAEKLDIIDQLRLLMGPIGPGAKAAPPEPKEEITAAEDFERDLWAFLTGPRGIALDDPGKELAASLSDWLETARDGDPAILRGILLGGFPGRFDDLQKALDAALITADTIPPEIKAVWVAPDGRARVTVFPKGNMRDGVQFANFVAGVRAVAPQATGAPVAIVEAGAIVSNAFIFASILAFIAIAAALIVILRRPRDVLLVLIPLMLAALYTLGTAVAIGMAFNYVNVIAVPLLLGVGVAFNIYFVLAWRSSKGPVALLQTPTARAMIFSACTTSTAFASLALSPHLGTASSGVLLMLALFYVLLSTIIIQPALMILWGRR